MRYYIYAYRNLDTFEIFYIGMGHGLRRFEIKKRNKKFLKYIADNDYSVFLLEQSLDYEEALEKEKKYIDLYNPCCNLTSGGERTNGRLISERLKGRTLSDSHKQKLSEAAQRQKRSMINNKRVVVLDKNNNIIRRFEAKYQIGIWLHEELGYGKNPRSAQRKADKYFKSGELFDGSYYFKREPL